MGQKAFLRPAWAQKFKGQPINGFDDRPKAALQRRMGPRVAKTQAHEYNRYLDPRLSLSQVDSC